MSIQDWGAIGEIVGAVAVVITLLYLVNQIRQARIATTDESRHHRAAGVREANSLLIENPELRDAFVQTADARWKKMLQNVSHEYNVSLDQAALLVFWNRNYVWTHWAQFNAMKTAEDRRDLEHVVAEWYSTPLISLLIQDEAFRSIYDPRFLAWIDRIRSTSRAKQ